MLFKIPSLVKSNIISHRRLYNCTSTLILKENLPGVTYRPEIVEKHKYDHWETSGFFKPSELSNLNFSMVLAPPNVTGGLHLGHALSCTIQDAIARRKRSMGHNVLWVPGTDHAGIATQDAVEKYIEKVKYIRRLESNKEHFNYEANKWKDKFEEVISNQLRDMGCSLDWSRQLFTMNPQYTAAVEHAFIELFNRGIIYRQTALVYWSRQIKSTVSDIEVEKIDIKTPTEIRQHGYIDPVKFGLLYKFAYKIFGTLDEVVVSTTSPETMLGDVAIAVNPNDERYKKLAGKRVFHPYRKATIPIVMDESVDMDFGTGVVQITPAHSKADYEIATKYQLPMLQVIDENGRMINSGRWDGMKRYLCRNVILENLKEIGLMKGSEPHPTTLIVCRRTKDVIECLPKEQWFVSCSKMNERTRKVVEDGQLKIKPNEFVDTWLDWIKEDRDWCISRQQWWGHQIPAYKCTADNNVVWIADSSKNNAREKAAQLLKVFPCDVKAERDQDVLDSWFSSGIYPFAALGWPEKTIDYDKFYPLSLMVSGQDMLGFWVHRMAMLGLELTDQLPFNEVLLHGALCDGKSQKMCKENGNLIDPSDVINGGSMEILKAKTEAMYKKGILTKDESDKTLAYQKSNFALTNGIPHCGADAFRFALLSQDIKSPKINFDVSMCVANKSLCSKIWQSVKYAQLSCGKLRRLDEELGLDDLTYFDKWILSRLAGMVKTVNDSLDNYDFHLAAKSLEQVFCQEFCDVYLGSTKPGMTGRNQKVSYAHAHTTTAVLNTALRCFNPFLIYLTEELIPRIPTFEHNIIVNYNDLTSKYYHFPEFSDISVWKNTDFESRVEKVLSAAEMVKSLKSLCGMNNRLKPTVYFRTVDDSFKNDLAENAPIIRNLAHCCAVNFQQTQQKNCVRGVLDKDSEVFVEILGDDVDSAVSAAKAKLQTQIEKLEKTISDFEQQVYSQQHLNSIPEWNKSLDKEKLIMQRYQLIQLQNDLYRISS